MVQRSCVNAGTGGLEEFQKALYFREMVTQTNNKNSKWKRKEEEGVQLRMMGSALYI